MIALDAPTRVLYVQYCVLAEEFSQPTGSVLACASLANSAEDRKETHIVESKRVKHSCGELEEHSKKRTGPRRPGEKMARYLTLHYDVDLRRDFIMSSIFIGEVLVVVHSR